jgi:GTP cyclohydrolase II
VVIYLQQEGRGIGLANKIAAYSLQDQGLDTVDANRHLGFDDDERSYDVIPYVLKDLGIKYVTSSSQHACVPICCFTSCDLSHYLN